jgi:O-antigen ligase
LHYRLLLLLLLRLLCVLRCAGWVATPPCVFVMLWSLGVSSASSRVCTRLSLPIEADVEHGFHNCMDIDGSAMVMRSELMDRESL